MVYNKKFKSLFIVLVLFLGISTKTYAQDKFQRICENAQTVAGLIGPWSAQIWKGITVLPPPAAPVANFGFSQIDLTSSPFFDFCMLYNRFSRLTTDREKTLAVLDYANVLSGRQFDEDIDFTRDLFDVYSATNDIIDSKDPKSGFLTQVYARRLNRFFGDFNDYYESKNGSRLETFNSREQQEVRLRKLVRVSNERSRLTNFLRCPKETPLDPKLQEEFNKFEPEYNQRISYSKADKDFIVDQLKNMAISMFSVEIDARKYLAGLQGLVVNGVRYQSRFSNQNYESYTTDKDLKRVKVTKKRKLQRITVITNPKLFSDFKQKYSGTWKDYTRLAFATNGNYRGSLNRGTNRVNDEWTDRVFECREHRFAYQLENSGIYQGLADPNLINDARKRRDQCLGDAKNYQFENVFSEYVDQLFQALNLEKSNQGKLWTLESKIFGTLRQVSYTQEEDKNVAIANEEITCSEQLNNSQIIEAGARLKSLEVESRGLLLESKIEKDISERRESDERKDFQEKSKRRRSMRREREKIKEREVEDTMLGVPTINSGI